MMMSLVRRAESWNVDIDEYLNRIIPSSSLHHLPTPVSRFLGYRKEKKPDLGNTLGAFWSCLGAFCGLAVIAAVFNNSESIQRHTPPALIASFGASAILEYNAIRSPLGQPRNALLGHTFSALIGVGITKLFLYHHEFERIRWIAGAVACGIASAFMLLTNTIHPPGGATAVLAATEPVITAMGWYFVGLIMLGTTLMLIVALVINNIQRQFPVYWWTPIDVREARRVRREQRHDEETRSDANGGIEKKETEGEQAQETAQEKGLCITIDPYEVQLPEDLSLNATEVAVLEGLKERLRKKRDVEENGKRLSSSSQSSVETVGLDHSA